MQSLYQFLEALEGTLDDLQEDASATLGDVVISSRRAGQTGKKVGGETLADLVNIKLTDTIGLDVDSDKNTFARLHLNNINHAPVQWPGIVGSVGAGAAYIENTRTGGYGSYGDFLISNVVTAATVAGELDNALGAWITHTNLQGGTVYGMWFGANSPAKDFDTYSSGAVIGTEVNVGNRWGDEGMKTDIGSGRWTVGAQIVPDVLPSRSTRTWPCTISNASPAVVTRVAHGLPADTPVRFGTSGSLPAGITASTVYYVSATGLTADTFQLKTAIVGGSAVNTSSAGSGSHYLIPSFPSSFGIVIARSIWRHRWWIGTFIRGNSLMNGGYANYAAGGLSDPADQPAAYLKMANYWKYGLDFQGCTFSDGVFNFDFTNQTASTATVGGITPPAGVQGYIKVRVSGTLVKIPYYNN